MTSISTLDLLVSRWSGLLVALGLLAGLLAFAVRERARSAAGISPGPRAAVIVAIVCAAVAVVGRLYPLLK